MFRHSDGRDSQIQSFHQDETSVSALTMYHTVRQDPFPALAPFPAPAPSPTAVPASAAAVAAASGVFSNPVRKNTPQMTPKNSQEPTTAAATAVPAGRGQHAPLHELPQ